MKAHIISPIFLLCIAISTVVLAGQPKQYYTQESQQLLEQLQPHIKETLRKVATIENEAGHQGDHYFYSMTAAAAHEVLPLGVVLDKQKKQAGFKVLSVTLGSLADKLQISAGDIILTINDIEITEATSAKMLYDLQVLTAGEQLKMSTLHAGVYRELIADITMSHIPEFSLKIGTPTTTTITTTQSNDQCGEVFVVNSPPVTKEFYPVSVHKVDGKNVYANNLRLSPGLHTLELKEHISDSAFARRRGEMKNRKNLEVNILPNTRIYLVAKFNRGKRARLTTGEYWQPVIWKQSQRNCSFKDVL